MARIRTVKPEFWQDEDLASCSEAARLLAIGLLNHADDEGYFRAHPALIKAAVFPITDPSVTIHGMLTELSNIRYLQVAKGSDGKRYGRIVNFGKHQKVNRPKPSAIKEICAFTDSSVIDHGGITTGTGNREQGTGKGTGNREGEQGTGTSVEQELDVVPIGQRIESVFQHWQTTMDHKRAQLDDKRRATVRRALESGYTVDDLCQAITGCSLTPHNMGDNDRSQRYDSLTLILRDGDQIDRFMANAQRPPKPKTNGQVSAAEDYAASMRLIERLDAEEAANG